ncbi:hypothetical protein [Nocardia mexicana]|uniref:DUF8020 domain-containing protein n=1 Tax=Nocardia mexicana TaxID=279262 RepID=A0A370H6U4_9NOCA|nr:hypothetical protein [Nocardia mexicana]RDI52083.1 hypothetical protein DFR68_104571 [Nocardia mexicana]
MAFGRITATVVMAITTVGITAATAHGQTAVATEQSTGNATSGVDRGVDYRISVSPAAKTITATIDEGRFEVQPDGASVTLESEDGTAVTNIPLRYESTGRSFSVSQQTAVDGRTLTLTPEPAGDIALLQDIGSYDRLMEQIYKNQPGVVGGAIVGALIGFLLLPLMLVTVPAGALIGAIAGGYAMGGQEFLDAVQAFATGQQ